MPSFALEWVAESFYPHYLRDFERRDRKRRKRLPLPFSKGEVSDLFLLELFGEWFTPYDRESLQAVRERCALRDQSEFFRVKDLCEKYMQRERANIIGQARLAVIYWYLDRFAVDRKGNPGNLDTVLGINGSAIKGPFEQDLDDVAKKYDLGSDFGPVQIGQVLKELRDFGKFGPFLSQNQINLKDNLAEMKAAQAEAGRDSD